MYAVGDRVEVFTSHLGGPYNGGPVRRGHLGTVLNYREPDVVTVQWDGIKIPMRIHIGNIGFIKKVNVLTLIAEAFHE